MLILPLGMFAQSTLQGRVLESGTQQPLPSVNISVEGSKNGTSTNFDGNFSLSNLKSGDVIVFSYVGFVKQTLVYDGQNEATILMFEDANQLEGVVVIGYGTVKKKDATGSVTKIDSDQFNKGAVVTAENLLNGRVAGLTVNTPGGPGTSSTIRIRGGSSLGGFGASNDPLIVIDGLPIENNANSGSTSILAALNPSDIESFTVLKDASATAIYGSRASNGVIIITTKKGGKELSIDYNFKYASGKLVKTVDVLSANEYRNIVANKLPGRVENLGNANTDWQDAIYRKTDLIDNNISVRGNLFNKIPSRLSLGNTYQEGLRLTNDFNRNTVGVSLSPSFFDSHLKMRVSANYANEKNRFTDGVEGAALTFDPTQPVYDANSYYGGFFEYWKQNATNPELTPNVVRNPVSQLLQTSDKGVNNRLFGNFEIDYKFHFLPELRGVVNLGFDESNGERTRLVGGLTGSAPSNNNKPYGTNEFTEGQRKNRSLDGYFNYKKLFNKLEIDATAGYSYQKFEGYQYASGNTLQPNYTNLIADTNTFPDIVLIGLFARTNFTYNDKYLLTLSYRRDGSSRFAKDNRWGNFPAAAFAWKLKEEFLADSKVVSDLKLRIGYGVTGQQDIGENNRISYLQNYVTGQNSSQYVFGPTAYPIAVSSAYNPKLKWEETTTYNVGLDYGLFDGRVTGAIEAFYKKSNDLLVATALPDGGNFSNVGVQNIGDLTVKGIEFAIDAKIVDKDNLKWNVNFNATKFERRIDKLALNADIYTGGTGSGTGGTAQILREGFTPYSFYVYKQLYDVSGQPIEGAYADLNGDGIINGDDRYIYKNSDPDATFGFASNLNYKNLDFSFNMRASIGNRVFNAVNAGRAQYSFLNQASTALGNLPSSVENTNFNTTADVILSDLYIENASFLRLENVTLGYTFPKWLEGKASLRLFTGVQNAFVITKYSGLDPEIANNGIDNTIYPRQRSLLFGANIKF